MAFPRKNGKSVLSTNARSSYTSNLWAIHDLGFDASEGFHTYGFKYDDNSIKFFVNGKRIRTIWTKEIPELVGPLNMHLTHYIATFDPSEGKYEFSGDTQLLIDWVRIDNGRECIMSTSPNSEQYTILQGENLGYNAQVAGNIIEEEIESKTGTDVKVKIKIKGKGLSTYADIRKLFRFISKENLVTLFRSNLNMKAKVTIKSENIIERGIIEGSVNILGQKPGYNTVFVAKPTTKRKSAGKRYVVLVKFNEEYAASWSNPAA